MLLSREVYAIKKEEKAYRKLGSELNRKFEKLRTRINYIISYFWRSLLGFPTRPVSTILTRNFVFTFLRLMSLTNRYIRQFYRYYRSRKIRTICLLYRSRRVNQ